MLPAFLTPYKDIIIIVGVVLFTTIVYGKGYHDRGVLEESKLAKSSLNSVTGYITDVNKMEKKHDEQLENNLNAIDKDQSDDGPVAPVLRNALDRLRVSK